MCCYPAGCGRRVTAGRRTGPRWVWILLLAGCLVVAGGCGYQSKQLFSAQYRTVAAPIFENRTFYRELQFDLSNALVKQIELDTPYKVVRAPRDADTILQGSIVDVQQGQLTRRRSGGVPQEIEVTVTVDFEWKDLRTGQIIRKRAGFSAAGRHLVAAPVSEPFALAQHAAVERLARDIVSVLREDW